MSSEFRRRAHRVLNVILAVTVVALARHELHHAPPPTIAASPVTKYFGVTGADFSQSRYATDAAAAEAILESKKFLIMPVGITSLQPGQRDGIAQVP